MAIWACQAKKDVYVEKPVSHNIWEGRKLVEAAAKYKRVVQTGTQKRSDEGLKEAFDYIRGGAIGKIIAAHGLCYKPRESIGAVPGPQPIPETVNYDLWTGPAPLKPLYRGRFHYDWHWQWATGNGDIGNQGVHEMDLCRWALGESGLPKRVMSLGGRFGYEDDGETANTQIAVYDYDSAPLIFEVRGLPRKKNDTAMDAFKSVRIGAVIACEDGYFAGGGGGGWIYSNNNERIKQFVGEGGGKHASNFIDVMRSRTMDQLAAPIIEGHITSALCHLGNISYRLGHLAEASEIKEQLHDVPAAADAFDRFSAHLFANWIDIAQERAKLGPWLECDPAKERFVDKGEYSLSRWANDMLSRRYREPFVVPKKV